MQLETFNEVEHMPLRVFNRAVMAFNLAEDFGRKVLEEYLELFSEDEKAQIFLMTQYIKAKGPEAARKFATKDLQVEYDPGEDDKDE